MKYFLVGLLLVVNLFALQEEQIQLYMSRNINNVVKILKSAKENNLSKKITSQKIFKIFDPIFDYKLMARLALGGRIWRTLDGEQKSEFTKLFIKKLKASYESKLDLYNGQAITVDGIDKIKKNRILLLSELSDEKQKYDITYKFYKAKNDQWYIYDVNILGVSIIQTYRAQFSDELKKMSFDALLKKLKKQS
ncbi:MAG: ABC transporter substrate-binding protein [Epsilonproteobacteria bacterium]|nr:ABC transporter substrate-binding protein [Campylobacterota bacterium]